MRIRAGVHARIAASAVVEVDQQEILRLVKTLRDEVIELQAGRNLPLLRRRLARGRRLLQRRPDNRKLFKHRFKCFLANLHEIHRIKRRTRCVAWLILQQPDLAKKLAAFQIRANQFAVHRTRIRLHPVLSFTRLIDVIGRCHTARERHFLRHAHQSGADEIECVRLLVLLADDLVLSKRDEFRVLPEMIEKIEIERVKERDAAEMLHQRSLTVAIVHQLFE